MLDVHDQATAYDGASSNKSDAALTQNPSDKKLPRAHQLGRVVSFLSRQRAACTEQLRIKAFLSARRPGIECNVFSMQKKF